MAPSDGLVSLKDIMEDGRLSWEGFDKFGAVQEILDHNKCALAALGTALSGMSAGTTSMWCVA